ncbi:hypothetical protein GQ607_004699 [Colletotrichum asianum]|uniref:Uncharacterized protein n=1 Tax=Colletotrichum asianum TaxID=702518 RepID=A0A8H3WIR5_9PEZI|nr:hypothetical protein GQ607_004699 [Colletotrichum asianum]
MYFRSRQQKISRQEPPLTSLFCSSAQCLERRSRAPLNLSVPPPLNSAPLRESFRTRRLTAASWGRGPRPDRGPTGGQAVQCLGRRRYRRTASQGPPGLFDSAPANLLVT